MATCTNSSLECGVFGFGSFTQCCNPFPACRLGSLGFVCADTGRGCLKLTRFDLGNGARLSVGRRRGKPTLDICSLEPHEVISANTALLPRNRRGPCPGRHTFRVGKRGMTEVSVVIPWRARRIERRKMTTSGCDYLACQRRLGQGRTDAFFSLAAAF